MSAHAAEPHLVIVDVGHGNSAVLFDTRGVVVIDAGPKGTLLDFLDARGVRRIDVLLISHADTDHIAGAIAVLSSGEFAVGRVRLNSDALKQTAIWDDLLHVLNDASRRGAVDFVPALVPAMSGEFDQGAVRVEIIGPSAYLAARGVPGQDSHGRAMTSNSISALIRLTVEGQPIALLPGDVDEVGLDDALANNASLRAPVAVFPHHGGRVGGSVAVFVAKFCNAVRPETVVFSIGRGKFDLPRPDVVDAVRQHVPDVRIACTQLSTRCAGLPPTTGAGHLVDTYAAGRAAHHCCAGTVVVNVRDGAVTPSFAGHRAFIATEAPTALCR